MRLPKLQALSHTQNETGVSIVLEDDLLKLHLDVAVLENAVLRVCFRKDGLLQMDRTWMVAPDMGADNSTYEGRCKSDVTGFRCPPWEMTTVGEPQLQCLEVFTQVLKLTIRNLDRSAPLQLCWHWRAEGNPPGRLPSPWQPLAEDRASGAYYFARGDCHRHAHYLARRDDDMFFGLGERTGNLNKAGRRCEMRAIDCMGYDAETTDPLYKHFPFYITRTVHPGQDPAAYGLFYDNLSTCTFDLGNELDNYHGLYKYYESQDGDLDYFMILGPAVLDVTKRFSRMTGRTLFGPRWSLGYCGSAMGYTEAPDAQVQLGKFLANLEKHDIPCSSYKLSSGYSSLDAPGPVRRHVFTWNHSKVPDPKALARRFADKGVHLAANVKPCILTSHPEYRALAEKGLFVRSADRPESPEVSMYWGGEGSYLDFTNPAAVEWWQRSTSQSLLSLGFPSLWNDNNEYEIWDDAALCHMLGRGSQRISLLRPLHGLLMCKASYDAQRRSHPGSRPWLISRGGLPGMQRYVQTWSGDNRTEWKTLRFNQRMGLGLSLSGVYNMGHDIGGFSGPKPSPELFVRWVQNGAFHPRFTIHSWNDDNSVNEPWMYEDVLHHVRDAIRLRYSLLPYMYTLYQRACAQAEPMLRPVFLDHEGDPGVWQRVRRGQETSDEFMLGRLLLVATVLDQGSSHRNLYLPKNGPYGWFDYHSGVWYPGGLEVTVPVSLGSIPMYVTGGAVLPMGSPTANAAENGGSYREVRLFPPPVRATCGEGIVLGDPRSMELTSAHTLYEDDGVSVEAMHPETAPENSWRVLHFELRSTPIKITVTLTTTGLYRPLYKTVTVILQEGIRQHDHRPIELVNSCNCLSGVITMQLASARG